jgi:prepilin-type processing-associated H-X9-DG protein
VENVENGADCLNFKNFAPEAVLVEDRSAAQMIPPARLPRQEHEQMPTVAIWKKLATNAKLIADAALMYSADHDDTMPSAQDDVRSLLRPYLGNDAPFDGGGYGPFVYTLEGGSIADVQNPSDKMMGYIPGPGGRAVVFADGHVRWIEDGQ